MSAAFRECRHAAQEQACCRKHQGRYHHDRPRSTHSEMAHPQPQSSQWQQGEERTPRKQQQLQQPCQSEDWPE